MSGVPVPIAAPGFRDELKGSGLGLGLTPRNHPIGMLALSAVRVRTSLHLINAAVCRARREPTLRGTPVPAITERSRGTICRTRRRELKWVVDAWLTPRSGTDEPAT